jgi:hypothetical protein
MSQALMKYHPRISYTYMPSSKLRVPWGNGGYLVRTNEAGFRSDTEFVQAKKPGVFRAIVFGDSQTAGDGLGNALRYTDLLEKALPSFEAYNYSLSGTGPDQQYLAYQEFSSVEHDLVIIPLYIENIRRVTARVVKSRDSSGEEWFRPKPYYLVENGELTLHNVPVPKQPFTEENLPEELIPFCYPPHSAEKGSLAKGLVRNVSDLLGATAPMAGLRSAVKKVAMKMDKFRPVPDFDSPDSPGWRVLRGILTAWIKSSRTPVLVVPIPHYYFLEAGTDASGYQSRFRELASATGCHLYDPLPDLLRLSAEDRKGLWSDSSGHLSVRGNQIFADLFGPAIRKLIPAANVQHASPA